MCIRDRYQTALDEYYSFIEEFPESRYSKEVGRIFNTTARFLKVDTTAPVTESN